MNHDEIVLSHISQNENISQRQLAQKANLSLGHLNLILHRLVENGLVRIERKNVRVLKYILTSQGIASNTKRTYLFIRSAFQHILKVQNAFLEIAKNNSDLYIIKEDDEIYEIVFNTIKEKKLSNISTVADLSDVPDAAAVIVWTLESEEECERLSIKSLNLLRQVSLNEIS